MRAITTILGCPIRPRPERSISTFSYDLMRRPGSGTTQRSTLELQLRCNLRESVLISTPAIPRWTVCQPLTDSAELKFSNPASANSNSFDAVETDYDLLGRVRASRFLQCTPANQFHGSRHNNHVRRTRPTLVVTDAGNGTVFIQLHEE